MVKIIKIVHFNLHIITLLSEQAAQFLLYIFLRFISTIPVQYNYESSLFSLYFVYLFSLCVSVVCASVDISQNTEVDLSCSGLTELDIGADEVFIVSSVPSPSRLPFSPHTVRLTFMSTPMLSPS